MKNIALIFMFLLVSKFVDAQNAPCKGHPLFASSLANHSVAECQEKEFDQMEIYQKDKVKGRIDFIKRGPKFMVSYKFNGDFQNRPSGVQICQNYVNAIEKAGGEILYRADNYLYGKLKKDTDIYWVYVYTDGSGYYSVTSIKEEKMKQDVVASADEIKSNIQEEGKAIFYGIYFNTGQAVLLPESAATLTEMSKFLKLNPNMQVYIVGHTDNVGDFNQNLVLSKNRANAVATELAAKYGVNKTQINAQGVASLAPVASNANDAGKAKNRRVEMVLK